jgi:hypothetical protein
VANVKNAVQEVEDRMIAAEKGGDFLLPAVSAEQVNEARGRLDAKMARRRAESVRRKVRGKERADSLLQSS